MKRLAKGERHRDSLEQAREVQDEPTGADEIVVMNSSNQPVSIPRPMTPTPTTPPGHVHDEDSDPASKSPRGGGKVKTWFKSHFSRPSRSFDEEKPLPPLPDDRRGFVGGASLTGIEGNDSATSLGNRSASMRAMALAGRDQDGGGGGSSSSSRGRVSTPFRGGTKIAATTGGNGNEVDDGDGDEEVSPMSSSSSSDGEDVYGDAAGNDRHRHRHRRRSHHRFGQPLVQPTTAAGAATTGLTPPPGPRSVSAGSHSPARDSRFHEIM